MTQTTTQDRPVPQPNPEETRKRTDPLDPQHPNPTLDPMEQDPDKALEQEREQQPKQPEPEPEPNKS